MFGQIVVMRLFRDAGFLTQICGNNFMVLKVAPPLVVNDSQLDAFVAAVRGVWNSPILRAHSGRRLWGWQSGLFECNVRFFDNRVTIPSSDLRTMYWKTAH